MLDKCSVQIFKAMETLTVVLVGTSKAAAGQELLTGGKLVFRTSNGRQDNGLSADTEGGREKKNVGGIWS